MSSNKAFSRLERFYATKETTYGTAVTPVGTDAVRLIRFRANNIVNLLKRRDKTGTRSQIQGGRGRAQGKWSYEGSLYGPGTAGTLPDEDVLFQMIFGAAPTVVADTSVTYALSDTIVSADLWSYRQPSTVEQRVSHGSIATDFQFTLGQDIAEWTMSGGSRYVLGSSNFSTSDTVQKAGLSSFPAEPGSQTYVDGGPIAGFTGAITIGGQTIAHLRNATIKGTTGNALVTDEFGTYYPATPEGDLRQYTFGFQAYDDDSAGLAAIKAAADARTPVDASIQIGTIPGNIFTFAISGIQFESPELDDSQRAYSANFNDSQFTSTTALAEMTLTLT